MDQISLLGDIESLQEWQDWANEEMERQRKRILELEEQSVDSKKSDAYWRGEALMLEKKLFEQMEDADRCRGDIERLNKMLLKAIEPILLEEDKDGA